MVSIGVVTKTNQFKTLKVPKLIFFAAMSNKVDLLISSSETQTTTYDKVEGGRVINILTEVDVRWICNRSS